MEAIEVKLLAWYHATGKLDLSILQKCRHKEFIEKCGDMKMVEKCKWGCVKYFK